MRDRISELEHDIHEEPYGFEVILDLHDCDNILFNRKNILNYLKALCKSMDMKRCDLHWWDYDGISKKKYNKIPSHLKGTSVVQFISTSTIVIHTLDDLKKVFINIFSCKEFSVIQAKDLSKIYFSGKIKKSRLIKRI